MQLQQPEELNNRLAESRSKVEETDNYIVEWSIEKSKWILSRKYFGRKMFMNSCKYKVPLIVAAKDYEKSFV